METTDAPQIIEHVKKSLTYTPYSTLWIPSSARFVVLGQNPKATGRMQIYELTGGAAKCVHECEKPAGFKCGTFGASTLQDRHLATGDFKGRLSIWDLNRTDSPIYSVQAHAACVNVVDGCGGQNIGYGACELVTGSRDGCVRVWDPRVREAVLSLEPDDDLARDCWAVAFGNSYNDDERCIVAGYDNGDVKLFDLRTNTVRWDTNVGNGVVSLEFDRKDIEMNKLCVTTLESRFRLYDMRTMHETEGFAFKAIKAHKSTVWLARHLPQNRDVWMTCGGNGGLNVYRYAYPSKRQTKDKDGLLKGVVGEAELLNARMVSTQPIVSFNWSPDKEGLCVMAALDQAVRVCIVTKLDKY
jgi:WD40 repeat protein